MTAASTFTAPPIEAPPRERPPVPPPRAPRGFGRGGAGGGDDSDRARVAITGMWIALAPILMLFMAFASAYVVRQGLGEDWVPVEIPRLLWMNTGALLLSSLALERARRREPRAQQVWILMAAALGMLFLAGQVVAWRELTGRGIRMATTPYSSFFYLLTGAHGVHLLGGVLGLGAAALWPVAGLGRLPRAVAMRLAAIYWHFMGLLWLGLFLLLLLWR
jgi:cytochrome c oxidase subunit 3